MTNFGAVVIQVDNAGYLGIKRRFHALANRSQKEVVTFLFVHPDRFSVDFEGVGVVPDEHAAHSDGLDDVDHSNPLAFGIV